MNSPTELSSPRSLPACGVGWALRESCPDGCLHRAELQVFVSGAGRRVSSLEHTPSPLLFNKTNLPLVRMGRW